MGAITAEGLGKAYKNYPSRWWRLREWLFPRSMPHQLKWVLHEISFQVGPGETVGVIGINGAGKSTLLKLISGITQPTAGSITVEGRLAALLELGMGFHPEFTGRQNAIIAGQLLGMSQLEVEELLPSIESFADIGNYIDRPIRVYSSGMQMRLAFAVATARRPDVLIVDEALAVGDAAFQRRCFARIQGFVEAGTTLLLVSHDLETIKKLCDTALYIANGRVASMGPAKQVCDQYERDLFGGSRGSENKRPRDVRSALTRGTARLDPELITPHVETYGTGEAEVLAVWFEDDLGRRINVLPSASPFRWCYAIRFHATISNPVFAMLIKTAEGVSIFGTDSTALRFRHGTFEPGETVKVKFSLRDALAPGVYFLNCGVRRGDGDGDEAFVVRWVDAAILRVTSTESTTVAAGLVELFATIAVSPFTSDGR